MALLMVIVCGFFSACSSEDNEDEITSSSILGTWYFKTVSYNNDYGSGTFDLPQKGEYNIYFYRVTFYDNNLVTFERRDGNERWYAYCYVPYTVDRIYRIDDYWGVGTRDGKGTYSFFDNTIYIGEKLFGKVKTLTKSKMVIDCEYLGCVYTLTK